jgi:malonate decarboxylase beta subunit
LADALIEDDTPQIVDAIRRFVSKGVPAVHRSSQVELYRGRIQALDTSRQWDPKEFRALWTDSATEGKR